MFSGVFTKENLKACGAYLWKFVKVFYTTAFFYMWYGGAACLAVMLVNLLLTLIGVSPDSCATIMKILYSIAPVVPVLGLSRTKKTEQSDEISMDLCFTAWIIVAVYVWKFL